MVKWLETWSRWDGGSVKAGMAMSLLLCYVPERLFYERTKLWWKCQLREHPRIPQVHLPMLHAQLRRKQRFIKAQTPYFWFYLRAHVFHSLQPNASTHCGTWAHNHALNITCHAPYTNRDFMFRQCEHHSGQSKPTSSLDFCQAKMFL